MMYNDVGIGYALYQSRDPGAVLTGITPTFEVHVNTPLTHRDWDNPNDLAGTPDFLDLTYGVHAQLGRSTLLTFGFVTPVTGPRPFDYEVIGLINVYFGGTRRGPRLPAPPMLGG
jgi:hypothetical protein